jgi:hypothetical protein
VQKIVNEVLVFVYNMNGSALYFRLNVVEFFNTAVKTLGNFTIFYLICLDIAKSVNIAEIKPLYLKLKNENTEKCV